MEAGSYISINDIYEENSVAESGGAFYNFGVGRFSLSGTLFSSNQANYGSAISSLSNLIITDNVITNATFLLNSASSDGTIDLLLTHLRISDSSFVNNHGAFKTEGTKAIKSNIAFTNCTFRNE